MYAFRLFTIHLNASGEFQDENSIPECKKCPTPPHKLKNLFPPRPIR